MSGYDDSGARPSIPEFMESQNLISSPVLNRKKQPENNQPSTTSIVTDENQVTLPHHAPDVSAGDISTHTRIKVEELKDEGLVNTQESLFDNEFWNVKNTQYPVDTSTAYRAHTHYQAATPYPKDRLTSFHEDTPFRAHTRYRVATEGNTRSQRSYSRSVQSNAN